MNQVVWAYVVPSKFSFMGAYHQIKNGKYHAEIVGNSNGSISFLDYSQFDQEQDAREWLRKKKKNLKLNERIARCLEKSTRDTNTMGC